LPSDLRETRGKRKPLPHVVIVDTNILWCKDKVPVASPDFDKFWEAQEKLVEIDLVIPDVVRGELLYQQATSCLKLADRITDAVKEISAISAAHRTHRITKQSIVNQVTRKVDKWIKSKSAVVTPTPIGQIDWKSLCDSAVWRLPPFTADAKNPDTEKGFRDALILETVVDYVTKDVRKVNIAFISNDFLLRTSVAKRLSLDKRFACYADLEEFASYIKLTRESLTNEFIKKIVRRASKKFFNAEDFL
jgi:hypothetical protein